MCVFCWSIAPLLTSGSLSSCPTNSELGSAASLQRDRTIGLPLRASHAYFCTSSAGRLTMEQKKKIASEITESTAK